LDGVAWDLHDDEATAVDDYDKAFRQARAVSAYLLAQRGDSPAEAVYEALHGSHTPLIELPCDASPALNWVSSDDAKCPTCEPVHVSKSPQSYGSPLHCKH
jgi:hypothetical protein